MAGLSVWCVSLCILLVFLQLFSKEASATSGDRAEGLVMVNEFQTRLSQLEAHRAKVDQDIQQLYGFLQSYDAKTLTQRNQQLEAYNQGLKGDLEALKQEMKQTISSQLEALKLQMNIELEALKQQMNQTISPQLETLQNKVNDRLNKRVSFNVRMTSDRSYNKEQKVQWDEVALNDGNGFKKSNNWLQAPVSGLYWLSVSSRSMKGYSADVDIVTCSRATVCRVDSYDYNQPGACSGAVRLSKGQKAWVKTLEYNTHFAAYMCTFSGFLIAPDP